MQNTLCSKQSKIKNTIPIIEGKQRILVAPLNWGLGHASRCIPLIYTLLKQGHEIILAADGLSFQLFKQEFPHLRLLHLPDVQVHYSSQKAQIAAMLQFAPKLIYNIKNEHYTLQNIIREEKITLVISDNRFGLWTHLVPCIYITHQLMIKMPFLLKGLEPIAWWLHRQIINKYTQCWIPDFSDKKKNLSGDLAHRYPYPKNAQFIGPLSRFSNSETADIQEIFHTVVVISGPEPQRSIFEKEVIQKLQKEKYKSLIVRGLPSEKTETETETINNITLISHLDSQTMKAYLSTAEEIICRSGYTSIMDLYAIKKQAQLLSTPGQTEQEYLAFYLSKIKLHNLWKA